MSFNYLQTSSYLQQKRQQGLVEYEAKIGQLKMLLDAGADPIKAHQLVCEDE